MNSKTTNTERIVDGACKALSWVHIHLGRAFTWFLGECWHLQAQLSLPLKLSASFLLLAALAIVLFWIVPQAYCQWAQWSPELLRVLELNGETADGLQARALAGVATLACLTAAAAAWVRRDFALWVLKGALALFFVAWLRVFSWTLSAPASLTSTDFRLFDGAARNSLWSVSFAVGLPLLIIPIAVLLLLLVTNTRRWFTQCDTCAPQFGDRVLFSLKTGGDDPRFRSSLYWAVGLTLIVLFAPFLIHGCGQEDPYGLVKGDGAPSVEVVVLKRIKEPKKEKKLLVNAWSPYIFDKMKIDDTDVMKDLLKDTMDTYAIESAVKGEKTSKSGKTAGWPKGMENATVRFIRLKYNGGDWNQDMGKGSDYNLLLKFNQTTEFPIAKDTEAIDIVRLRRFPKHKAPPFVFLTGRGNLSVSDADLKALRWYLEDEGGLLFIDNGGGSFDRSVTALLSRVLPGKPLLEIASDDPIFQSPYVFPDGAPPFWHHAGMRARGIKINGRWAVFYHPGDMNDAWKDGHSGAAPEVAAQAYKLGINVMYYAFNAYYRQHYEADASESK